MEQKFNVVFSGQLKAGFDLRVVAEQFAQRFNYDPAKALEMISNGAPVVLKRDVGLEMAEKFQALLDTLGMLVTLESANSGLFNLELESVDTDATPDAEPSPAVSTEKAEPDTGDYRNPYQKVAKANPYQAPEAELSHSNNNGSVQVVSVDAGRGMSWLGDAFRNHVKKDMGAWIGAFVIYIVLYMALSLVPFLGGLAAAITAPVVMAGFMLGAHKQTQGEAFAIGDIFTGFSQNTGQLMMIGVLYLVGMIVLGVLTAVLVGGSFAMSGMAGGDPNAMLANMGMMLLPILFVMLLAIPLMMAYWFAAPLVIIDNLSAVEAMKLSFSGCLKNLLPLLVYSIVAGLLLIVGAIPLFLGLLIVAPVMMASMYVAYRDIFHNQA